ncbi:segregation/condensation protein A [Candidatus Woesearchaeota archaeon]|nr:segregation/condensation protein A [Candidatus Woesearchaeota archaeon]
MNEQIFDMLLNEQEISWRTILMNLVHVEGMDPWHIDITALTKKYIQVIKEMKEHDLKISGKIVLAAAILLKVKSTHLVDNDISRLDELINETDEDMDDDVFEEIFEDGHRITRVKEQFTLIPRNPQPRNRKVSIHDLVDALQRAMASKKRILAKMRPDQFKMPERQIDIMEAIRDVYHKLHYYSKKEGGKNVSFTRLLPPNAEKLDKVFTFMPLLHLENQHKLTMAQETAFGEIQVQLPLGKKDRKKAA